MSFATNADRGEAIPSSRKRKQLIVMLVTGIALLLPGSLVWRELSWRSMQRCFEQVRVGDTEETLRSVMGEPNRIVSESQLNALFPTTAPQDHYWDYGQKSFYLSRGVSFKVNADGKVVSKSISDP
jgi:hypothetical protein